MASWINRFDEKLGDLFWDSRPDVLVNGTSGFEHEKNLNNSKQRPDTEPEKGLKSSLFGLSHFPLKVCCTPVIENYWELHISFNNLSIINWSFIRQSEFVLEYTAVYLHVDKLQLQGRRKWLKTDQQQTGEEKEMVGMRNRAKVKQCENFVEQIVKRNFCVNFWGFPFGVRTSEPGSRRSAMVNRP